MISALPITPESGRPAAIDFATVIRSGSTPVVLDREDPAGAPEAGLDLVDDEDDPVLVADPAHALAELGRRDDEAAFALYRLDHDRGDVLGGDLRDERALERRERVCGARAAVLVRERHAVDLGRERPEPRLVRVGLRGQGEREQRPAVEAALEGDHAGPPGVGARELDRVLDGLGARVEERGLGRAGHRRELESRSASVDVDLVRDDREVGVREARELLLRRRDDLRVRVADVQAADAAGEVDERVAVDVGQRGAPALRERRRAGTPRAGPRRRAALRSRISRERGPGISVRSSIVRVIAMS